MINKVLIIFLSFFLNLSANASGAIAYSALNLKYFVAINKANEQEAIDAVMKCRDKGYPDCTLIHSINWGGYGAIAKSSRNSGSSSALGYKSKQKVESLVLTDCNKKFGKCTITDSWQDVGRIVEVPAERRTGPFGIILGCTNPNTKLGDPECDGIDVNGNRY